MDLKSAYTRKQEAYFFFKSQEFLMSDKHPSEKPSTIAVTGDFLSLTAQIVSAYVSNNSVGAADLPALMNTVHQSLQNLGSGAGMPTARPDPAVPVRRSITPEYIICLEDGKKLKMLKRHLKTAYNLTPEQYRERWGLGADGRR
jgi:predicted transcriptional regulator